MLQAHDRPKRCVHVRPQPAPNSLFPTKSILHTRQLINRQHTSHQPFTVLLLKQGPPWTPPPHHQNCKQEKKVTSDGGLPAPFRSNYGCPFGFSLFPTFNFRVVACQINSSETAAYLLPSPSTPDQPKKEKYQQFHQKKRSQKVVNFLIFLPPPIIFWMKPSSSSSSEVLFGFPTFKMGMCQHDPDVLRWGLDQLVDVCSPGNNGSPQTITGYDKDFSQVAYVKEGYCENDETIARAYQEELSRLAAVESMRSSNPNQEHQQESVLAQDWYGSSDCQRAQDAADEVGLFKVCSSPGGTAGAEDDELGSPEIEDDSILDGEVGKRLNQMCPVPHVPKINGEIPSADEATSDHQRLLDRLQLYDLIELKVSGDGNCQVGLIHFFLEYQFVYSYYRICE
ncbi:OLC1v1026084C2 [Oldenlandia corymbosa var. corymbosa]|uniref:OLC1v1026084C2 n=1 Tax=Oldenlandia corymbosa var. corymbosa TaxID=529605 RepID=A0AAV1C6K5_OLDCO|nr:OLC1v1026084C2 [Oldenlandia corymbosa var. corymbosa]